MRVEIKSTFNFEYLKGIRKDIQHTLSHIDRLKECIQDIAISLTNTSKASKNYLKVKAILGFFTSIINFTIFGLGELLAESAIKYLGKLSIHPSSSSDGGSILKSRQYHNSGHTPVSR